LSGSTLFADNRSNQMNPNNAAYWQSRGYNSRPADWQQRTYGTYDNNRANQLNPNNDAFYKSRENQAQTSATRQTFAERYRDQRRAANTGNPQMGSTSGAQNNPSGNKPPEPGDITRLIEWFRGTKAQNLSMDYVFESTKGFSFTVPKGYNFFKKIDSDNPVLVSNREQTMILTILHTQTEGRHYKADVSSSIKKEYGKMVNDEWKSTVKYKGFSVYESDLCGKAAVAIEIVKEEGNRTRCISETFLQVGNDCYCIDFVCEEADYGSLLPVYENILDSFKLNGAR
jgi:hypothetical protein